MGLKDLPAQVVGLVRRILGLPAGIHTITLVKVASGARGIIGWAVVSVKLESAEEAGE